MTPRVRHSLALTVSVALHASVVLWGAFSLVGDFEVPEIEFEMTEIELLDPTALRGAQPDVPEPPPVVAPPPAAPEQEQEADDGAKPEPEPEQPPKPKLGDTDSKVDELGPAKSTVYAFLVNERLRKLEYASTGVEVMAPLPDFQYLIQNGGFDTLHDFDYLVIASSNVLDITQTFLAAQPRIPMSEVLRGVERAIGVAGEVIEWEQRDNLRLGNPRPADPSKRDFDPRWFVFLEKERVVLLIREEFLPFLTEVPSDDASRSAAGFVANLANLKRFAKQEPSAGLQMAVHDLRAAAKRAKGIPFELPDDVQLFAEATAEPQFVIKASFLSVVDAKTFETWWRDTLPRLLSERLAMRLAVQWLYDLMELERTGEDIALRGRFSAAQAEQVLKVLASLSQRSLGASPEEMEQARRERQARWEQRKNGKLPPSAAVDGSGETEGEGANTPGSQPEGEKPEADQPNVGQSSTPTIPGPEGSAEPALPSIDDGANPPP